jgi:hypothetical protein
MSLIDCSACCSEITAASFARFGSPASAWLGSFPIRTLVCLSMRLRVLYFSGLVHQCQNEDEPYPILLSTLTTIFIAKSSEIG